MIMKLGKNEKFCKVFHRVSRGEVLGKVNCLPVCTYYDVERDETPGGMPFVRIYNGINGKFLTMEMCMTIDGNGLLHRTRKVNRQYDITDTIEEAIYLSTPKKQVKRPMTLKA